MSKKLLYIRLDASHEKGMGHLFRMLVLAEILRPKETEIFFVIRENRVTERLLDEKGFRFSALPINTGELEIIKGVLNGAESNPLLWIFDILNTETKWIRAIKEKGIKVVTIDDEKGGLTQADMVINPIVHYWKGYNPASAKARLLEGSEFALINQRVFKLRKKREIRKDAPIAVGVAMGGSDSHGVTVSIVGAFKAFGPGRITLTLFAGPHFQHFGELKQAVKQSRHEIEIKKSVPDLHSELDRMDVVVCGGGLTLFEVAALGLPALALANEPHEEKTIRYLRSINVCGDLGAAASLDEDRLGEKLKKYIGDTEFLNSMSVSNYKRFHANGAYNCANAVLSLL